MFKFILLFSLTLSFNSFAQCSGAAGASRTNPDLSPGGFVANTAFVEPSVFTSASSQVCDTAKVYGDTHILGNAVVKGGSHIQSNPSPDHVIIEDSTVEGLVKISDSVKVRNGATVKNYAQVSGNSLEQGDSSTLGTGQS